MPTARQVFQTIERWQAQIATYLGTDLDTAPQAIRSLAKADVALEAILIAVLLDKGVVTAAELQAKWDEAKADAENWPLA